MKSNPLFGQMNDKPFSHICRYGTIFTANRCDFAGGVTVTNKPKDPLWVISDVAEMIGYHATNVHPNLNGFQGYDCIDWK